MRASMLRIFILAWISILASCVGSKPSTLSFDSAGSNMDSVSAFKETVYPILRSNCLACHATKTAPFFASENLQESHDALINSFKVNLQTPSTSRIYQRVKTDNHNCWGNCSSNGAELLTAITKWAKLTVKTPVSGIKTAALTLGGADKELPVLDLTTIFEAEQASLAGRALELASSAASSLKAITTSKVGVHPTGYSTRYGEIKSACRATFTDSDFSLPTNQRPYQVFNKVSKFPGPNDYSPYFLTIKFYPINPLKRTDYLNLLKANTNISLEQLAQADLLFKGAGYAGPSPIFLGLPNAPILLPDGLSIEEYNSRLAANTLGQDYFAKRYNGNTTQYQPTDQELRETLDRLEGSQAFIRRALYPIVARELKRWFYNGSTPKTNQELIGNLMAPYVGSRDGDTGYPYVFDLRYDDAGTLLTGAGYDGKFYHNLDKYVYMEVSALETVNSPAAPGNSYFVNRDVRFIPVDSTRPTIDLMTEFETTPSPTKNYILPWYPAGAPPRPAPGNQPYNLNDVTFLAADSEAALESFNEDLYSTYLYPVLTNVSNKCLTCHAGQLESAPAFAVASLDDSYHKSKTINGFILSDPAKSALFLKMKSHHSTNTANCGTAGTAAKCDDLAQTFLNAITTMSTKYNEETVRLQGLGTFTKIFSKLEQTPAQLEYKFTVKSENNYRFMARVRHPLAITETIDPSDQPFFRYELLDANGTPVKPFGEADSCQKATLNYPSTDRNFIWVNGGLKYYTLTPGQYSLRIFEGREGIEFDQIGFSNDLTLEPQSALMSTPARISKLKFDVAKITGVAQAKFVVEVSEFGKYYKISKPHFEASESLWVRDIQVMINGVVNLNDATFRIIKKVIPSNNQDSLIDDSLLVLRQNGSVSDTFTVVFQELRKAKPSDTNGSLGDTRLNSRLCRDPVFFRDNVAPIFKNLQLWLPDSLGDPCTYYGCSQRVMKDHSSIWYFRTGETNNCINCHNAGTAEIRSFMPSDPLALCHSIMKKINFDDPESSLIFKGLDGQQGHIALMFPEQPVINGDGEWLADATSYNGKSSVWVTGSKLSIYANYVDLFEPGGTCTPANVNSAQEEQYLRKFIGTFKRKQFVLGNIFNPGFPFAQIMTQWTQQCLLAPPGGQPNNCLDNGSTPLNSPNFTKKLYPGDYACSTIPLGQRLAPQAPVNSYDGGGVSYTPDGMLTQNSSWHSTTSTVRNREHLSAFLDVNPAGTDPNFTLGRDKAKAIILKWILREKAARPQP